MKKLYFALILLITSSIVYSQPQITSSFNPVPGDNYTYVTVNTVITPGSSGSQVTWDFSTIQIIYNPNTGKYLNPSLTPYAASFPGATVAFEDYQPAGTYHYFIASPTKYEKIGDANVVITNVYDNPATFYTYPFTYNTKVTSNYACTTQISSTMTLEKTATWEAEGDAWGALLLPTGTHQNVLRIKTRHFIEDNYVGSSLNTRDIIEYDWVSTTTKKPLLRIITEYHSIGGTPDTLSYILISDEVSGLSQPDETLAGLSYWPNPASDFLNIGFDLKNEVNVTYEILSSNGQQLSKNTIPGISPGNNVYSVSLENLEPGFYLLKFNAGVSSYMIKFIKI